MINSNTPRCMDLYAKALLAEKKFKENYTGKESSEDVPITELSSEDVQIAESFFYTLKQYEESVPLEIREKFSLNSSTEHADLARKVVLEDFRRGM